MNHHEELFRKPLKTFPDMKGRMEVLPGGALVSRDSIILGDVRLEREVNIWFGSVLRGDDEPVFVGERTNIQDGCVVHVDFGSPCRIGCEVTVGHKALIHGCTIGDRSLIGMGSILLTGCRIGEESIIGAGCLVPEGMEIPPRSLVLGVPGRIRREVTGEEAREQVWRARFYLKRARSYL